MNRWVSFTALLAVVLLFSCNDMPKQSHGPIVLGDSSAIVTEKDPQKLQDLVTDLQPTITSSEPKDTTPAEKVRQAKPADTAKKTAAEPQKTQQPAPQPVPAQQSGLVAAFKDVTVVIPGVEAKIAGNEDLQRANGATYSYVSGTINGAVLRVSGTVTKVSMRYMSVIVLKNDMGTLPLETLSNLTSWETMKGINGVYHITDLDERSLDRADGNRGTIQAAVRKTCQRRRISHRRMEEWMSSVRNVRNTSQRPLSVALRSVMFKIDGKDANGRMFSKQIRIDIPM